jgi:murein DD-endopeptidase MepM/ murein hydrolase activator NlpD
MDLNPEYAQVQNELDGMGFFSRIFDRGKVKELEKQLSGMDKYISYDEYKANNFIQGRADLQYGTPVPEDTEISTLFGATGNLSNYPHRGIDLAVEAGTKINPLLWNDQTVVLLANYGERFLNSEQGQMVGLNTDITYLFKGELRTDTVLQRYMHLNDNRLVDTKNPIITSSNTVIANSGNTGMWDGQKYAAHLHLDISIGQNRSPYLDLIASNNQSNIMASYFYPGDKRVYYDPLMFLRDYDYTIRTDAWGYNKW